jgi:diguanylate cyclase (GGDEF)-like protein
MVKKLLRRNRTSEPPSSPDGFLSFEVQHHCRDGRLLWGEVLSKPEHDEQGAIVGYHGITREITARKLLEDQVRQLAFHDPLTGLPNRRLLLDRLSRTLAASKRSGLHCALMFLDLDNFKSLNDRHGHQVGDSLLLEVTKRLNGCVREVDTVSRFGGDEFVVLLGDLKADRTESTTQAALVAEKIRVTLQEPYSLQVVRKGHADLTLEHHGSASIGVIVIDHGDASQEDILKWADSAMYRAKDAGRNAIRFHEAANTIDR